MKVLFVINGLGTGGAERSLAEMLPRLTGKGIRPTVVCLDRVGEGVVHDVLAQGFDVRFLRGAGLPSWVLELRRIIRAERPDLVQTVLFEANLVGRLAAIGSPAAVVTSLVSTPYDEARLGDPRVPRGKLEAVRLIDSWSARHLTRHFHAVSEAVKRSTVAKMGIPAERITVIQRGRDAGRLGSPSTERRRRARAGLGLSEGDEVLVNVGRQEFPKGQRHLIEAMGRLRDRHRLLLLQAGRRGHVSPELADAVHRSAVGDRVRFLGHRDDVPELLAAADLFVFPSIYEGIGGAAIEAMALALPIVASDIPALREAVEQDRNALLVEPGNSSELARAISELLDDRERLHAFGVRSREIFEESFSLERSVEQSVALYRRLARGHRAPGQHRGASATGGRWPRW